MSNNEKKYAAKAFVSCSLRDEDQGFVDFVCRIIDAHSIEPFGTVGKFSASPESPFELIKKNVSQADMVVICLTKRYVQQDIKTGNITTGYSEMIHFETGIATALGKPIVVFVNEGTDAGKILPNLTQYIVLNGNKDDYNAKKHLISSLLKKACEFVEITKNDEAFKKIGKYALTGLALFGGFTMIEKYVGKKDKKRK